MMFKKILSAVGVLVVVVGCGSATKGSESVTAASSTCTCKQEESFFKAASSRCKIGITPNGEAYVGEAAFQGVREVCRDGSGRVIRTRVITSTFLYCTIGTEHSW